jgi:hypothetical protein
MLKLVITELLLLLVLPLLDEVSVVLTLLTVMPTVTFSHTSSYTIMFFVLPSTLV